MLAQLLGQLTNGRVPAPRPPAGVDPFTDRVCDLLARRPVRDYGEDDVLERPSRELAARLDAGDLRQIEQRIDDPQLRALWDEASEAARVRLALVAAAYYDDVAALRKTGLTADTPPESVHAMTRGPVSAGGDPWLADDIVGALDRAGRPLGDEATVLDFGCSSARAVRVLAAWRPELRWLACDPNAEAIAWARAHVPGVEFFASPQDPPLPLEDAALDVVYAISIWSHFGHDAALRWLAEMQRVIRPGGVLLLTTHGLDAAALFLRRGWLDRGDAARYVGDLIARGHAFADVFGAEGDWGVVSAEWGQAYMTLDWLMENAAPQWSLRLYEPGGHLACQDVIVLEREPA
jgi:SAM-dependent methyltransferase